MKDIVNWITFVSWIISVSLDPYICYVPSIDDEKKLLKMNSSLMITIWVLLYSLVLIPKMEIRAPVFSVLLAIFLAVYLMRIIGIYRLFTEEVTRSTSSKIAEAPIIKIAFNLLLFLYGGHLFGGLWYLFAVWKQLVCWRKVCLEQDHQICHYANNRFNVNPEGNKLLSDTCFAKIEDTYELGIFKDAFESRIVEDTSDLGKKLFYCFRWGLQNIRFRRWSDTSLLHLCDCVKPVVYDERTRIVREGDPINEMLFVLHGKLWNFSSVSSSTNNVPPHNWRKEFLKDGDFWGEEIVNWVQDESSSSSSIDDLKTLFNEKAKILQSWFRKRKNRQRWMELLTAIKSNREQTPPGDQLTGPEIDVQVTEMVLV
ncbi:hypothetical protein EZV62_006102 [Acer yangbiense]|uniref:Cyclic nucleotide-binding domain-containing protein n=1 Tax=Acer yangbiense TaxID=1000413 RepID=A0A5C7IP57_9ROSI|nr:hypothetical protein EZV62_006102 [Acer yangbiense]